MANQEKNPCKGYKPNGEPCPFGAKPGQMYCGKHENNHGIPAAAMVQPTNQNGSLTIENEDQSEAQELGPVEISAMAEAGTMPSDPSDMPVPAVSSEYLKRIGDISTRQKNHVGRRSYSECGPQRSRLGATWYWQNGGCEGYGFRTWVQIYTYQYGRSSRCSQNSRIPNWYGNSC